MDLEEFQRIIISKLIRAFRSKENFYKINFQFDDDRKMTILRKNSIVEVPTFYY